MPKPANIDDETWRLMIDYGGDPYVPRQIKVDLLSEWSSADWTLPAFAELIASCLAKCPSEFRERAVVDFEGGDSESSGHFEIYYHRPETMAEMKVNAARYLEYVEGRKKAERDTYENLKRKFG